MSDRANNVVEYKKKGTIFLVVEKSSDPAKERVRGACQIKETADRMCRDDSDAVISAVAYMINGVWYAPCTPIPPTEGDEAERERNARIDQAKARARAAGLLDEDIAILRGEQ